MYGLVRPVYRCHRDDKGALVVSLDAAAGPQVIIVVGAAAPKSESSDQSQDDAAPHHLIALRTAATAGRARPGQLQRF